MERKDYNKKIIFGLKVKQLRLEKGLTFEEMRQASSLSISYLNEIEKGKKYPKGDKIALLASTLEVSEEELTSDELSGSLAPVGELLNSNFLNDLPLEVFGIEMSKVVEIIANSPVRVRAFISTLVELSRNYALQDENFYFGALRAYQEIHYNYFEEIEQAANDFLERHNLSLNGPMPVSQLRQILEKTYSYEIVDNGLSQYPELQGLRALFIPKKNRLMLGRNLTDIQKGFVYGRELGVACLALGERTYTSPIQEGTSFEAVLNNFKANYFSIALFVNKDRLLADIQRFFGQTAWRGDLFLELAQHYVAPPEFIFHRLTSILPQFFGLRQLFFLRMHHEPAGFMLSRVLHLNRQHHPHRSGLHEHYCRRWVEVGLLKKMAAATDPSREKFMVEIQRSKFMDTDDEYLCIALAGAAHNRPGSHVCVSMGILVNDALRERVKFIDDPSIPFKMVNTTCERCPATDCHERAAPSSIVERKLARQKMQQALKSLLK